MNTKLCPYCHTAMAPGAPEHNGRASAFRCFKCDVRFILPIEDETDWIAMDKQRPTEADFVKDEWAVIFLWRDGHHSMQDIAELGAHWNPDLTHWRKVRLCPSPKADGDEAAWREFEKYASPTQMSRPREIFEQGRRTMREEIAAIVKRADADNRSVGENIHWVSNAEWLDLRRYVGIEP